MVDSDLDLSARSDFDAGLTDDSSRGLATLADKLESGLRAAVSDLDQSSVLAIRLMEENAKVGRVPKTERQLMVGSNRNSEAARSSQQGQGCAGYATCAAIRSDGRN